MPWRKIKRKSNFTPRTRVDYARVYRNQYTPSAATLLLPSEWGWLSQGERISVYADGNGSIAFLRDERGDFKVYKQSKKSMSYAVTIPAEHAKRVPVGTNRVSVVRDTSGMIVLNLNAIGGKEVAA